MNNPAIPQKLKLPSHVLKFHCAQCGECCTNKWQIAADTVSYTKLYQKFEQLGREKEFYNNILHNKIAPRIRFLENGKCPYLTTDNLCAIQLDLGAEYLLDICKVYPRRLFASPHAIEFSLSLTCKTAVQTLQQEPIHIIETNWPIEDTKIPFSFIQPLTIQQYTPDACLLSDRQLPYHEMETRFIEIIQNRRLCLNQRMVFLGQTICRLISRSQAQDGDTAAAQDFQGIFNHDPCFDTPPDLNQHLKRIFLMSNIFLKKSTFPALSHHVTNILLALSSDKPCPIEEVNLVIRPNINPPPPSDYQQKLAYYYRPALSIVEPILENYMVNYILGKPFYTKPIHFAYYRMAFLFAAAVAFSLAYSILKDQLTTPQMVLQAIYDVENIFYTNWFYPHISLILGGTNHQDIVESGIILANLPT